MIGLYVAAALAVAPMPACPSPKPLFATIAIDPAAVVLIPSTRQFAIALRATEDGGYHWQLQNAAASAATVSANGEASAWDTAFTNAGRPAGSPPMVGGEATEFFLFTARAAGEVKLIFGLFGPGKSTPTRTTTYTVRVVPYVMVC
jgi:hypothetical protein